MKYTPEEIKNRLSNIGEAIGGVALEYIADLEQKLEQTEEDLAVSEHDREHNDYEFTEVYNKIEQLEKENAELKSRNGCETCTKFDKVKLAKAKELLKFWVDDFYDAFNSSKRYEERHKAIIESEQFLKENEE